MTTLSPSGPDGASHPLPPDVLVAVVRAARARVPTVWDARRWLRGWRGRAMRVVLDTGAKPRVPVDVRFLDVVRGGDDGFALVLQGLAPAPQGALGRERVIVPMALIRELPDELAWLRLPPERWPLPAPFVTCSAPGCGVAYVSGRFCPKCGRIARRGRAGRVLGAGFAAHQQVLRRLGARGVPCVAGCGAWRHVAEPYCGKCGATADGSRSEAARTAP